MNIYAEYIKPTFSMWEHLLQTVIAGDEKEYHIGYFRDDPFLLPSFVASMSSVRPGTIIPIGENIFAGIW